MAEFRRAVAGGAVEWDRRRGYLHGASFWGVIRLKDGPSFISTPVSYVSERVQRETPATP